MKYYDTMIGGHYGGPPKPYFTKYLPDPKGGEIKEGDWILANGTPEQVIEIKIVDTPQYKTEKAWWSSAQKVKLFLCSRDIQVGDEIMWIGNGDGVNEKSYGTKSVVQEGTTDLGFHPNWVKVIGEVSPEATWVKEGMEFDEEDLLANGVGVNYNNQHGNYIFQIKCPNCLKFH